MAGQTPIPPRFDFKSRPFKGLTVRQISFLALFGSLALLCLMTPFLGSELWVRAVVALFLLTAGLLLAFLSPSGLPLTAWGSTLTRYFTRARLRVWRRTAPPGVQPLEEEEAPPLAPAPPAQPVAPVRETVVLSPLGVIFDLVLLFVLYLATWYMASGGGEELAMFWQMLTGH